MAIPIGATAYNPQTGHTIVMTATGWAEANSPQMPQQPGAQDAMKPLQEDAQQAAWLAQKANQFTQIQQGKGPGDVTGTGLQYHDLRIPIEFFDKANLNPAVPLAAAINPRIGDLESVTNQAWAHMRPQGSGAMRMPEVEGFQQSFPNIENSPQTNQDIQQRLNQDAQIAAQKLQFIDDFMRSNAGSYADANQAWQRQQANGVQMSQLPPVQQSGAPSQFYNTNTQPGQGGPPQQQPMPQQGAPQQGGPPMQGGPQQPPPPQMQGAPQGPPQGQPMPPQQPPAQGQGWQIVGVS